MVELCHAVEVNARRCEQSESGLRNSPHAGKTHHDDALDMFHRSLLAGCSDSAVFRDFSKHSSISTEAASIRVIKLAANNFSDLPSRTASQPTLPRQAKTRASRPVVAKAAGRLHRTPRAPSTPQTIESAPKAPPDISAVFAFSGLDK